MFDDLGDGDDFLEDIPDFTLDDEPRDFGTWASRAWGNFRDWAAGMRARVEEAISTVEREIANDLAQAAGRWDDWIEEAEEEEERLSERPFAVYDDDDIPDGYERRERPYVSYEDAQRAARKIMTGFVIIFDNGMWYLYVGGSP